MKFEDKLKTLEDLVGAMEGGQMKLDDMITAFERGRKLVAECRSELDSIRTRIEKITASGAAEPVALDETGDVKL